MICFFKCLSICEKLICSLKNWYAICNMWYEESWKTLRVKISVWRDWHKKGILQCCHLDDANFVVPSYAMLRSISTLIFKIHGAETTSKIMTINTKIQTFAKYKKCASNKKNTIADLIRNRWKNRCLRNCVHCHVAPAALAARPAPILETVWFVPPLQKYKKTQTMLECRSAKPRTRMNEHFCHQKNELKMVSNVFLHEVMGMIEKKMVSIHLKWNLILIIISSVTDDG